MDLKNVRISGIGKALPERIMTNHDIAKIVDTSDEWITQRTGIKERRVSDDKTATSDLCIRAAEDAIKMSGIDKNEIDFIIVGTVTPDYFFPSTAGIVQKALGIEKAAILDIEAGCSGFLYALAVARRFIAFGGYRHILAIGAETLTKIVNWEDRNTCVLFGDGAGAAVLSPTDSESCILSDALSGNGNLGELLIMHGGGSRNPISQKVVDDKSATICMESGRDIFKNAVFSMYDMAHETLNIAGITTDDVKWLIPHQANLRIMDSVIKKLGIEKEKLLVNLEKYGNTSAGSIPIALTDFVENGTIKKGDLVLLVAFGAGFTSAGTLLRW